MNTNFFIMNLHVILTIAVYFCWHNVSGATPYGADNKLSSVVVMYRHGDRTPRASFPKDTFFNKAHLPEGFSAFLNKGKLRHYNLGLWFRTRYGGFLSEKYNKSEIRVLSADTDTCLMSAECNLAGLYKLKPADQWFGGLSWDPIPVHTEPEEQDATIAMEAPCAKYEKLYAEVKKSKPFVDAIKDNAQLIKFLSEKTGWDIQDIDSIRGLYSIFYIYSQYNSSYIPAWAAQVNRTKVADLAALAWARETYTPEMKRLKAGPFFDGLLVHFDKVVTGKPVPKFGMVSSSIHSLTAVLNTMDVFDNHPVEFAATIIWELSKNAKGEDIMKMYYKKEYAPEMQPLKLKGCPDFACDYKTVKKLLSAYAIDGNTWLKECKV